jgi:hypothetical protein
VVLVGFPSLTYGVRDVFGRSQSLSCCGLILRATRLQLTRSRSILGSCFYFGLSSEGHAPRSGAGEGLRKVPGERKRGRSPETATHPEQKARSIRVPVVIGGSARDVYEFLVVLARLRTPLTLAFLAREAFKSVEIDFVDFGVSAAPAKLTRRPSSGS